MKFITEVNNELLDVRISLSDKVMVLGSCFADNVGERMKEAGFDVCVNPFGTLYNPASVCQAVRRLSAPQHFALSDCVKMGAGSDLICSFSHHTSFARTSAEEFLSVANARLDRAAEFWGQCTKVIVTLGTAFVWERKDSGLPVSNCLKRPASEFTRRMLSSDEIIAYLHQITSSGKEFIFTVSPIRHLGNGAHANTLSKASLHLGISGIQGPRCAYFPAFEILNDELRDYRFYAEDLVHPSPAAISYIWEKFIAAAVPVSEHDAIRANERASRREHHRNLWPRAEE